MQGTLEQKRELLSKLSELDLVGCWGLTEPNHGSDVASLDTTATKVEGGWILNGRKRWIGNGTFADVAVIWAKNTHNNEVRWEHHQVCSFILKSVIQIEWILKTVRNHSAVKHKAMMYRSLSFWRISVLQPHSWNPMRQFREVVLSTRLPPELNHSNSEALQFLCVNEACCWSGSLLRPTIAEGMTSMQNHILCHFTTCFAVLLQINAFIVRKGTAGFHTEKIENKISLRCVQNANMHLKDVFVTDAARIPGVTSARWVGNPGERAHVGPPVRHLKFLSHRSKSSGGRDSITFKNDYLVHFTSYTSSSFSL